MIDKKIIDHFLKYEKMIEDEAKSCYVDYFVSLGHGKNHVKKFEYEDLIDNECQFSYYQYGENDYLYLPLEYLSLSDDKRKDHIENILQKERDKKRELRIQKNLIEAQQKLDKEQHDVSEYERLKKKFEGYL